jgi:hypothetical protein
VTFYKNVNGTNDAADDGTSAVENESQYERICMK